jgi:hypothetical protein
VPKLQGVNHQAAVKAFQEAGYWVQREGKHIVMTNGVRTLTIPRHNPVNAYTMGAIVVGSGMSIEEFSKLL